MTGSYQGGYYPSNMGGGGGSGYIQYHTQILNNNTLINVTVGDHRQVSVVTINGEVIEAAAGQDSYANGGSSGGDGYSGGGAYGHNGYSGNRGNCDGGSDGGNGEAACNNYGHPGGSGTEEDVTNFVLTPGA